MNTEQFIIIPYNSVHDVRNQATKVRRDHSFRWIYTPDAAWLWPTHQTALLNYGGDDPATLRCCPNAVTLLLLCLFHKMSRVDSVCFGKKSTRYLILPDWTKTKNTGARYAVTVFVGRQRYNATSACESLSGANSLKQQAAPRSRNTL